MRYSFVELESGDQEYFDDAYSAFRFAKDQEHKKRNSVSLVAVGKEYDPDTIDESEWINLASDMTVYRGQMLRHMIRSLDNTVAWLRTQIEEQRNAAEEAGDS